LIGDHDRDLECAVNAGLKSVLVQADPSARQFKSTAQPTFTTPDAPAAIAEILKRLGLADRVEVP
jgi:histidinol phosphatase-like enzyme